MGIRKKFLNNANSAVDDAIRGLILSDDRIGYHPSNPRVILRKDLNELKEKGCVTIGVGGGSGHEPFTSGFVGPNGMSAAICGDIYASPPASHVSDALEAIFSPKMGSLIFCNNYTGDRLHFGMAVERFRAKKGNGTKIDLIYVDDDVSLEERLDATAGRRGLAGGVLILHMIGVMAEERIEDFGCLRELSRRLVDNLGTYGVSLEPCALPGRDLMFQMPSDSLEFGLGIHGESGVERRKMMAAKDIANEILSKLTKSDRLQLSAETPIVVLLNNLGSTSQLELGIMQNEILLWFFSRGFRVLRMIVGSVTTSIDGHGISVSILKVLDSDWITLLDTKSVISEQWHSTVTAGEIVKPPEVSIRQIHVDVRDIGVQVSKVIANSIQTAILGVCEALRKNEDLLNRLDSASGDGDCGMSLRSAANAITEFTKAGKLNFSRPKALCLELSDLCEQSVGGTSGALYAIFFSAAANAFDEDSHSFDSDLRSALLLGLKAVAKFGRAKPNHRTMVDALAPAVDSALKGQQWSEVVKAAEEGAEATAQMSSRSGRASYTAAHHQQQPDPGAKAVAIWLRAAFNSVV